ncbi:MAG: hypothetical protein AAGK32_11725, partial [Actinomycetota bacterium]
VAAAFARLPVAGWGWAVGGGLLVLAAAIGALLDPDEHGEPRLGSNRAGDERLEQRVVGWVAPGLAALPAAVCGLAVLKWSFPEAIFITDRTISLLVARGVGFLVLAVVVFAVARLFLIHGPKLRRAEKWIWRLVIAIGVAFAFALMLDPVAIAPTFGALAVLMLFLSALVGVVTFLLRTTDRRPAPYGAYLLGFNHPPVLLGLLIWAGVAAAIASAAGINDAHQVRASVEAQSFGPDVVRGCGAVPAPDSPEGVFGRWLARNGLPAANEIETGDDVTGEDMRSERPAVPVVMVAGSGGGIRAAYWTAATMEQLFGRDALGPGDGCPTTVGGDVTPDRLLFASGISGSSLGLAAWSAAVADGGTDLDPDWPVEALGDDYISAQLAWGLLVEVPRLWLRFDMGADRAEMLERSWEQSWNEAWSGQARLTAGHLRSFERPIEPQLVLGGAVAQDGCWLIVSGLRISPPPAAARCYAQEADGGGGVAGSYSVTDFTCPGTDLRRSTAALLSARFPLVSP